MEEAWKSVGVGCVGVLVVIVVLKVSMKREKWLESLREKHVVITGGSSGIGLALAERCLMEGAFVTLVARTHTNLLNARRHLLQAVPTCTPHHIRLKAVDVASPSDIRVVIEDSFKWRPIDVLVCNAGIARGGFLEEVSTSDLEMQYRINLMGSIYPVHAALPFLKPHSLSGHHTSILFINSLCSLYFACGANTYMVSKYAQKGLAELLRMELRPWNINVQLVIPGYTETQMLDEVDKFSLQAPLWRRLFMFNRANAQTTEEVAEVTVEALKQGNFLTTTAGDGFILGILGRALVPEDRPLHAILELLFLPIARIVSFFWVAAIHAAVRREAAHLKAKLG